MSEQINIDPAHIGAAPNEPARPRLTYGHVAGLLESRGWKRSVAGAADFDAAVAAIIEMNARERLGLIVSGGNGRGKTSLLRAVTCRNPGRTPVPWINLGVPDECEKLTRGYQELVSLDYCTDSVVLDDFGAEDLVNEWGIRIEPVGRFVMDYYLNGTGRLIISTNLTANEIEARYGGRVISRLKELCIPLRLQGTDKRKWTPVPNAAVCKGVNA